MVALTLGLSLAVHASAEAPDGPVVSEAYRKFTLFTADQGELKQDVIVVFHGFASAMPNGAYKRLRQALGERYSILGFNYDYFDFDANHKALDIAWTEVLNKHDVTFAGTSLGGFWANYYADKYNIRRLVIVNPVVDPHSQLQQFIGRHYVEKRQAELVVTASDIDTYKGLTSPNTGVTERLVILTRDDEVLDPELAADRFSGGDRNTVMIFDEGGHTLNLKETRFMQEIRRFLGVE